MTRTQLERRIVQILSQVDRQALKVGQATEELLKLIDGFNNGGAYEAEKMAAC